MNMHNKMLYMSLGFFNSQSQSEAFLAKAPPGPIYFRNFFGRNCQTEWFCLHSCAGLAFALLAFALMAFKQSVLKIYAFVPFASLLNVEWGKGLGFF